MLGFFFNFVCTVLKLEKMKNNKINNDYIANITYNNIRSYTLKYVSFRSLFDKYRRCLTFCFGLMVMFFIHGYPAFIKLHFMKYVHA